MVTVGFIVEGEATKVILQSANFQAYLKSLQINCIPKIIDAGSNGNFLPHNRTAFVAELRSMGAEKIIFLLDQEQHPCFTSVKERVNAGMNEIVIISKRSFEAWYLSDSSTMSALIQRNFSTEHAEEFADPYAELKNVLRNANVRGPGPSKVRFATRMINNGFDIINAAKNPGCISAQYFISKLNSLSK